ncbi:hypothetical protein L7F22_067441 [Adiantum nelumboides]|nr:hypothetical protein [Adiantum nelumboides]
MGLFRKEGIAWGTNVRLRIMCGNRALIKGILNRLGCDVTFASSGIEALQIISHSVQSFRILVIDVSLPGLEGLEVGMHVKEMFPPGPRKPLLVALTANADSGTRDRCLSLGIDCVVVKPVTLEKMRSVLGELLSGYSGSDNASQLC